MHEADGRYEVKPLKKSPRFLSELQRISSEKPLPQSLAEYFTSANMSVRTEGDTSAWDRTGKSTLFVGNHRDGFEYFLLASILGQHDRNDLKVIGKSYTVTPRLSEKLDSFEQKHILPVLTGALAKDKGNIFNRDIIFRMQNIRNLPTREEIKKINTQTLHDATDFLSDGYAVAIFPTGAVNNALKKEWFPGIGRIINYLPEDKREEVTIVPFQFEPFLQLQLIKQLWLHGHGIPTTPKEYVMHTGRQITVAEFLATETNGSTDPKLITQKLQSRFLQDFK